MGIFTWVLVGVLVGFLFINKLRARGFVLLGHLAVSVLGALLGGLNVAYLYQLPGAMEGINWIGILAAFLGAFLANALLRLILPRKTSAI